MNGYSLFQTKGAVLSKLICCLFITFLLCNPFIVTGGVFEQSIRKACFAHISHEDVWHDGSFSGNWKNDTAQGYYSGAITLGR